MLLKKNIPVWFIARKVWLEAITLLIVTVGIYLLRIVFKDWHRPLVPFTLVTLLGTAISLLLAFRINQSYDRWWEARIVWGAIVNDSRTLLRQAIAFSAKNESSEARAIVRRIGMRQVAWCYCLGRALRGQEALSGLQQFLEPSDYEAAARADNKPNILLMQHQTDVQLLLAAAAIDSFDKAQIDNTLSRLCDHMGKCERIKSTIFPSTYSLFIHSFIYLFIFLIPFGLGQDFGVSEIPLTTGIGIAFFLIEKTAMHMQDPFENRPTDTAMTTIATNIHRNIMHMLDEGDKAPEPLKPEQFYAM